MDRNDALARAFDAITWSDEPFDPGMGDLDRLARSVSSSVETVALHSLARIHGWLWPLVKSTSEGTVLIIDELSAETIRSDDDGKFVSLSIGGGQWVLSWGGMEGEEPTIRLGLAAPERDSGQRKMAYCTIAASGGRRGRLMAEGGDVERMFDMFSALRQIMPSEHLKVIDGSRNDDCLRDFELDRILEIDGGLVGSAATELYRMAEQHAASVIFRWAAAKYDSVSRFLLEKGIVPGSCALKFNDGDRIICGVETGNDGQRAIFDSRFPHERYGNRFLTWIDFSYDGAIAAVHSFAIPDTDLLETSVELLRSGRLQPSVTHEYASKRTIFSLGGAGMRYLESMAFSIGQADLAVREFDPKRDDGYFELIQADGIDPIPSTAR
jgi:hypothetical protein